MRGHHRGGGAAHQAPAAAAAARHAKVQPVARPVVPLAQLQGGGSYDRFTLFFTIISRNHICKMGSLITRYFSCIAPYPVGRAEGWPLLSGSLDVQLAELSLLLDALLHRGRQQRPRPTHTSAVRALNQHALHPAHRTLQETRERLQRDRRWNLYRSLQQK